MAKSLAASTVLRCGPKPVSFYFCLGQYDTAWGVRPAICDGGGEYQAAELGWHADKTEAVAGVL